MTLYQSELLRQLSKYDCGGRYSEKTGQLQISYNGIPLCVQSSDGYLCFDDTQNAIDGYEEIRDAISGEARTIREYVRLYESSPQMEIKDVRQYRKFAEYGDTVLAGMCSDKHGFMFSTWKQDANHTSVTTGDYSPNFEYAKNSFATRSGLVSEHQLFTEDEAAELYKCVSFAKDNCDTLTYDQEKALGSLMEKLCWGYPQLEANPPSFDQEDAPQLNM